MNLVFMGTSEFALPALAAIAAAGHETLAVYTRPPRPAGRGHQQRRSPVHEFAAAHRMTVRTPANLKDAAEQQSFAAIGAAIAVVAAYGLLLPPPILAAPRLGCINIHASLLPRWRGAAPIARAIEAGDRETGVTIMQMDAGLDTGPMLLRESIAIGPQTTAGELHDALAQCGAGLVLEALERLAAGTLKPVPQPRHGATYANKIEKHETRIDWREPAQRVERHIRALSPAPGAWFEWRGERIKVLNAVVADASGVPGTVLDAAMTVACGKGAVRFERLQRAGKGAVDAAAFLRGFPIGRGAALQ